MEEFAAKILADMAQLEATEEVDPREPNAEAEEAVSSPREPEEEPAPEAKEMLQRMRKNADRAAARKAARLAARRKNKGFNRKQETEEIMSKPLEQITDVIKNAPKDSEEYRRALYELDVRKRQLKLDEAKKQKVISDEMLAKAGYKNLPQGHATLPSISAEKLKGDLDGQPMPVPMSILQPNLYGELTVQIVASDGTNLLADESSRAAQRRALTQTRQNVVAVIQDAVNVAPPQLDEPEEEEVAVAEQSPTQEVAVAIEEAVPSVDALVVQEYTEPADFLLEVPIIKKLGITRKDIAITSENEDQIKLLAQNNEHGLALVKPFSIPEGVVGYGKVDGKECVIAFDRPDERFGQPGQLLAIFEKGSFRKVPTEMPVYDPNVIEGLTKPAALEAPVADPPVLLEPAEAPEAPTTDPTPIEAPTTDPTPIAAPEPEELTEEGPVEL